MTNESWEYYDDIAHVYDKQYDEPYWILYHELLRRLVEDSITSSGRILDIGTGTGRWALFFAAQGFEVVAVDPAREMLAKLTEKAYEYRVYLRTVCCKAEELPFEEASFDYITAMGDVVSYSRDHLRLLKEVSRILIPGGRFLFTVDSAYAFLQDFLSHAETKRADVFMHKNRDVTIGNSDFSRKVFKTHPFFPNELCLILEKVGLLVIDRAGMVVMGPYVEKTLARSISEVAEWEYRLCREPELVGRAEHLFFSCEKG